VHTIRCVIIVLSWFHKLGSLYSIFHNNFHPYCVSPSYCKSLDKSFSFSQCFDTVDWASGRASGLYKIEWWVAGMVICLERGENDLHMVQLMLRTSMRSIATGWVAWAVGLSVWHSSEPCKTAEPIEMPFRLWIRVGVKILHGKSQFWRERVAHCKV